tara:strand:+ start:281 stop:436 length:156 start_codon:yes stop_codon:yes gene_type:complete
MKYWTVCTTITDYYISYAEDTLWGMNNAIADSEFNVKQTVHLMSEVSLIVF